MGIYTNNINMKVTMSVFTHNPFTIQLQCYQYNNY